MGTNFLRVIGIAKKKFIYIIEIIETKNKKKRKLAQKMPNYGLGHVSRNNSFNNVLVYREHKNVVKADKFPKVMNKASGKWGRKRKPKNRAVSKWLIPSPPLPIYKRSYVVYDPILHGPKAAPAQLETVAMVENWCKYRLRLGDYHLDPQLTWHQLVCIWWQTGLTLYKSLSCFIYAPNSLVVIRLVQEITYVHWSGNKKIYDQCWRAVITCINIKKGIWNVVWKDRSSVWEKEKIKSQKWIVTSQLPAGVKKLWVGKFLIMV